MPPRPARYPRYPRYPRRRDTVGRVLGDAAAFLLVCAGLLLIARSCGAQEAQEAFAETAPLAANAIAETVCLGGRVRTVIDVSVLDTDSTAEILVHEAKHREQQQQAVTATGRCRNYGVNPAALLDDEVEAYCASRPVRMHRGVTKADADAFYQRLLRYQFGRVFPTYTIVSAYTRGCP